MPVRAEQSPVKFKGCDLAKVTMNREGVRIEFEGGKALTIIAQKAADINSIGTFAVTNFVAEASTTLLGSGLTVTKMEVKVAGVTVQIENGKVKEIIIDQAATGTKLNLEGATVDKIDTKSSVEIKGTGTVTVIEKTPGVQVDSTGMTTQPTVIEYEIVKYNFIAQKGTEKQSIVKKEYKDIEKMNFDVIDTVYKEVGTLSDEAIDQLADKAMGTVKKILELENSQNVKYVNILDNKINNSSDQLKVFVKGSNVAFYINKIAQNDEPDKNLKSLTKELVKADLKDILDDLAKLFPDESIPNDIAVKVINKNGDLEDLTNKKISEAEEIINAKLGEVDFKTAEGKIIIEIGMNNTKLSLIIEEA